MMSDYKIDKNVPIPDNGRLILPLREMQVGDSIEFPKNKRPNVANMVNFLSRIENLKFTIRKTGDETCRVWRLK